MTYSSWPTLRERVATKRAGRPMRATADEIGISASTLSRIEWGHMPDIYTFRRLCIWLGVSADVILELPTAPGITVEEQS